MTMTAPVHSRPDARPAPRPAPGSPATPSRPALRPGLPRPALRLVRPATAPKVARAGFVAVLAAILLGGLLLLLVLHTVAAQDGFAVHRLSTNLSALQDQEQQESVAVDELTAPSRLAAQARALGMRPSLVTSYHRMRDGRVVAEATPVQPPAPVVIPSPPAPSPKPSAKQHGKQPAGHKHP